MEAKTETGEEMLVEAATELREMAKRIYEIRSEKQLKQKYNTETIDCVLRNMRLHLGTYIASLQWDVLLFFLSEMPEKLQRQLEEERIQEATGKLLDEVSKFSVKEQISVCEDLVKQLKAR